MREVVDVIFIGAINYDHIFQGTKRNTLSFNKKIENGTEIFLNSKSEECEEYIQSMYENYEIKSRQLGGSAFLALKALKTVDSSLKTAYVGVCGKITNADIKRGICLSQAEFDVIDCKKWFFDANSAENTEKNEECDNIGKAVVLLKSDSTREKIEVFPEANNCLLKYIHKKEKEGDSFVDFLSNSRWVHITSLAKFDDFLEMIEYVRRAKAINPFLKVSGDLGDEYTLHKRMELIKNKVFEIFDFLFLSNKEKENLMINPKSSKNSKNNNLKLLFQANGLKNQQILVVKYENKYELYNKIDGEIYVKEFWQETLARELIVNDTGAGDFFAGGFIAGMLSDRLLSHQPIPIVIGSIVAKERLKANTIESACKQAYIEVDKCLKKTFSNEETNMKQLIYISREKIKKSFIFSNIVSLLIGIVSGIICELLF